MNLLNNSIFTWIVLPVLIFIARIVDVTIGTIRIVFISRGNKIIAPILGFFEILIWIVAISKIMQNLSNIFCYIAYAGGFATGNLIGMLIEEKLAMGYLIIRIITAKKTSELIGILSSKGYGVTSVKANGMDGSVDIIYTIIKRENFKIVEKLINETVPNAFYSTEDLRNINKGIFPINGRIFKFNKNNLFKYFRKGK